MIKKISDVITSLLVVWVLLAVLVGFLSPGTLKFFSPYKDYLFSVTMFGIGMVLRAKDFEPIIKDPKLVALGTLSQFAIMPFLGFLVGKLFKLPQELALGMILVGAVPGAMASNVIAYLSKGDVAYSVALTSFSTFLAPVLTPSMTYFYANSIIPIKFWTMFFSIIKMVIIPLVLGMYSRHIFRYKIEKILPAFPAISSLFIAFICGLVVALNRQTLVESFSVGVVLFLAIVFHNGAGLVLGYLSGIVYRFGEKRKRTLAIEVGMQNAGLGAVLALNHFGNLSALPNALFATWCIITASFLAEYWSRRPPQD